MSESPQVLVVDDDESILSVIDLALSADGYNVLTASDGAQALDLLRRAQPELILLDMRMPVMDGWSFARAYREQPGHHAPIVVMTAARDAAAWAAQVDAAASLAKPFDLDELLTLVGRYAAH